MRIKTWKRYDNKKTPLTDEEIQDIVNKKYSDCLPHTKEYIANNLRKVGPKFKARICIMVKEDFIEEFLKLHDYKNYNFDFSKIPDIIQNKNESLIIICKEKINGIDVGELEVSRTSLFDNLSDPISSLKNFFSTNERDNYKVREKYLPRLLEKFNDIFDFTDSIFVDKNFPIRFKCNKCGTYFWDTVSNLIYHRKPKCLNCSKLQKREDSLMESDEKWKTRVFGSHPENCDYTNAVYNGFSSPITGLTCKLCGKEFEQLPEAHLRSVYGCCPECAKKLAGAKSRSNLDNVKQRAEELHGIGTFNWEKAVYVTNQTPITLIDVETGIEFEITPNRLLSENEGLPINHSKSLGERNVLKWLESESNKLILKYYSEKYHPQEEIQGKNVKGVKIDYEIYQLKGEEVNYWIECNGKQHYEYSPIFYRQFAPNSEESIEEFRKQLKRDNNVRQYCKENNIVFIEIPYTYYSYSKIDDILTRVILNGESPDFIKIPEIKYL